MFKKKLCNNCGKKANQDYDFCPHCGSPVSKKENWGMIGKDDFTPFDEDIKLPMGMGTLFNSLMKNLDKQFKNLDKEIGGNGVDVKKSGISINISTSGDYPPKIKIKQFGGTPETQKIVKEIKNVSMKNLSQEKLKKISKLPKKEPATEMRRLSNRVVYEISIPGVKSIDNISIIRLESSIEIKAIGDKLVYSKIIPINLPIRDYRFSDGKLILELDGR
ncbi:MAG: zinc ribbon domain-containing protein [Nanoarchaeota archaeon]|nr:zinc ribbon domain-containing protein [Nanoarchaeota archaeon]